MRFHIKVVQLGVLMCLGLSTIHAEDTRREEANQLILRAREASCSMGAPRPPYEESGTITFLALAGGETKGTLRKYWTDSDNFLTDIREGDYQQLVIRKDGKWYRRETATFTPLGITQLRVLMPPFCVQLTDEDIVRKLKDRMLGDSEARCIEYDSITGKNKVSHEICIDKTSSAMLSYSRDEYVYLWNKYTLFDGKLLPHHAELRELGSVQIFGRKIIDADFDYSTAKLTPASIVVPDGVQQDRVCKTRVRPSLKSAPDPVFPVGVPRLNTQVVVRVIVGLDGTIHDSQIVQTGGRGYDEAAQQAVKRWVFMPQLCDGQPEETQYTTIVNFGRR